MAVVLSPGDIAFEGSADRAQAALYNAQAGNIGNENRFRQLEIDLERQLGLGSLDQQRNQLQLDRDLGQGQLDFQDLELDFRGDELGLRRDQFTADQTLRNQLLGFLGLSGPAAGPQAFSAGGPGGPGAVGPAVGGHGMVEPAPGDIPVYPHSEGQLTSGNQYFEQGRQALLGAQDANLARLDTYGEGRRQRLDRDQGAAENSAAARLESRGLGATNLVSAAQSNVADTYNLARSDLEDQILQRQIGVVGDTASGVAGLYGGQGTAQADIIRGLLGQL